MVLKLDKKQREVLQSIMDTFIAPLDDDESLELVQCARNDSFLDIHMPVDLSAMAASSATDLENAVDLALAFLERSVPPSVQLAVMAKLRTLSTSWSLLPGYKRVFTQLTRPQREQAVLKWAETGPAGRQIFQILSAMSLYASYGTSEILRSPAALIQKKKRAITKRIKGEGAEADQTIAPFKLLTLYEAQVLQEITFDVIVIGSGAGAGVIAAQVASVGESVLVIEKDRYEEADQNKSTGTPAKQSDSNGVRYNKTGSVGLLAGKILGGGTSVDWSLSLDPATSMLEEWSAKSKDLFDPSIFKRDLAAVRERIGASVKALNHNRPNTILKEGCAKLGVPVTDCPINNREAFPRDRKINTASNFWRYRGGEDTIKQVRTANSWLRDAEAYGARFIDQTKVTKILINKEGKASGVECLYKGITPFTYSSKIVVVADGSLHTPILLRRSGLKNKHIGRHLRLHPTVFIQGFYDQQQQEQRKENDTPLETAISHVADKTCNGHRGAWIQVPTLSPALASVLYPWRGALLHKQTMAKFQHSVPLAITASDRHSENSVKEDHEHNDNPLIQSALAKLDESTLVHGLIRAFRILAVTGARELHHSQLAIEPFRFDATVTDGLEAVKDTKFNAWLDRVRQVGIPDTVLSMHQMGTCRMGKSPQKSVAKVTGETWEVENLYVGDASLFMTASGVDPMLTVETLAYGVARNIISRLGKNSW